MHEHNDEAYEAAKDHISRCDSNEEALKISKTYHKSLTKFLPKQFRYYLYTVSCRKSNIIPMNYYNTDWDK